MYKIICSRHRTYALMWWILSYLGHGTEFDLSMYVNIIINIHVYTHCSSQRKRKTTSPTSWSSDLFAVYGLSFEAFASNPNFENATSPTPSKSTDLPCFQQGTSQCVFKSIRFCSFSRSAFSPQFRKGFMASIQRQSSAFALVYFR